MHLNLYGAHSDVCSGLRLREDGVHLDPMRPSQELSCTSSTGGGAVHLSSCCAAPALTAGWVGGGAVHHILYAMHLKGALIRHDSQGDAVHLNLSCISQDLFCVIGAGGDIVHLCTCFPSSALMAGWLWVGSEILTSCLYVCSHNPCILLWCVVTGAGCFVHFAPTASKREMAQRLSCKPL